MEYRDNPMKPTKPAMTTRHLEYLDKHTVLIEGREGNKLRAYPMAIRDNGKAYNLLPPSLKFLILDEYLDFFYQGTYNNVEYEAAEQYTALCEVMTMAANGKDDAIQNCDLRMAKIAILKYMNLLRRDENMTTIQCGTKITDRTGADYMAYSYKLTDYNKAIDLLSKVDMISTAENMDADTEQTDDSYNAMIEIVYMSLNEKVSKEDIEKFADAEFCRKVLRAYYDIEQLF